MGLNCGLIGLTASGKTTIFNAITAAGAASYDGSEMHKAVVQVLDPRLQTLADMYNPARVVPATLEIVDIPGLKTGADEKTGRSSRLLKYIKDVDALLHVVRCFDRDANSSVLADIETIDLELMVADSQTIQNKLDRLAKKVKSGDKNAIQEVADCEKVKAGLDQGIPARRQNLNEKERASIYECNLVSLKPVLYIANIKSAGDADDDCVKAVQTVADADNSELITVCGKDEADISQLEPDEQKVFLAELGLNESSMTRLLQAAYKKLGLITFFTVGADEVRAWTCSYGDKAPVAAGKIHSDMEKGFIRMEVTKCSDLLELGNEAAVSKAGKKRVEGKTYEVQEGDIVTVLFSAN
jgi:GTP-binding protein YchF